MTVAHLLLAMTTTTYTVLAIQFEERDLVPEHGPLYEEYWQRVPMLRPFGGRSHKSPAVGQQPLGSAARRLKRGAEGRFDCPPALPVSAHTLREEAR
jgi:hypothetical protein